PPQSRRKAESFPRRLEVKNQDIIMLAFLANLMILPMVAKLMADGFIAIVNKVRQFLQRRSGQNYSLRPF
ncbi:MAG TPA: hypothetical protein VNG71_11235, partial [Pyrinomonadaceae bacterium]|nr:hypothetical protein [Pyrinomonadaceae bacterium]